jgi:poly(ADP-ribose) glycohydrolase ARH3
MPTLSQFQGCLLGKAVSDGLGAPWEGVPPGIIFDEGPAARIVEHLSGETLRYTDDTQMAIGVAEALCERGTIEPSELAVRFVANYDPNRGYGQGARKILSAIESGTDWSVAAKEAFGGEGSLGNGAAMRASPIGVLFANDLDRVAAEAERSALPTHAHPIGIDGARLQGIAVALATRSAGSSFDRVAFLETLRRYAQTEEFQWQVDHALKLEPYQSLIAFGNRIEAHRSVMTSILCFVDSPDDWPRAVARAIGQGDDVDTLAAMTGALVGARLGLEAIPPRLIDCLEDDRQGRSYLLELSSRLSERSGVR